VLIHECLYIGGEWRHAAGNPSIEVRSLSTEELVGAVPEATPADVEAAVAAASRALKPADWAGIGPERRADLLGRFGLPAAEVHLSASV